MKIKLEKRSELAAATEAILDFSDGAKIWLFYGEMGAGKTTLIASIAKELGVKTAIASPTFSIVNEYRGSEETIYHFDFYRLRKEEEAYDLGYEEYLDSGHYCFIEWPEKISLILPEKDILNIRLEVEEDLSRTISLERIY